MFGDAPDFRRHGGGEEQGLARERHQLADALDVRNEAHVEHAVGFVDHQQLDAGQQQPSALVMVEQAARRRDQHVDAARQLGVLVVERNAADDQRDVELVLGAVLVEALLRPARRVRASAPGSACAACGRGRGLAPAWSSSAARKRRSCRCRSARCRARRGARARGEWPVLGSGSASCSRRRDGGEYFFGQAEMGEGHEASGNDGPRSYTAPDTGR